MTNTIEQVYNLVREVNIQKPFEDVTGEPKYVTDEIIKLLTTAKREALWEVREKVNMFEIYPDELDNCRRLKSEIITHLESELTV